MTEEESIFELREIFMPGDISNADNPMTSRHVPEDSKAPSAACSLGTPRHDRRPAPGDCHRLTAPQLATNHTHRTIADAAVTLSLRPRHSIEGRVRRKWSMKHRALDDVRFDISGMRLEPLGTVQERMSRDRRFR